MLAYITDAGGEGSEHVYYTVTSIQDTLIYISLGALGPFMTVIRHRSVISVLWEGVWRTGKQVKMAVRLKFKLSV
jgi:hypothetical protein